MSREIGFRVWDKENEEYMNGYDVLLKCDGSAISRYALGALDTYMPVNVIIERDTGLKDKNGKRICEGDIVKIWNGKHSGDALGGGYAIEGHWFPMVREVKMDTRGVYAEYPGYMLLRNFANIEVIGNIHENPELLGGEK